MVDIADFARRVRNRTWIAGVLFFGGALLMLLDFRSKIPISAKGELAFVWLMVMALGGWFYFRSLELPLKEIMQLAETHNGLLTVTEITTSLSISPDLALRSLRHLQSRGLARVSFQSLDKNLWEFPDCTKLPITQALDIARDNGGRVSVANLIESGITLDLAQQTIAVLQQRGLLRPETGLNPDLSTETSPPPNLQDPPRQAQ